MSDGSMNLTLPRSEKSVWDKPGLSATLSAYDQERWFAAGWGSALVMLGARRGGFGGGLLAMTGIALAVRAAMGRHDFRVARGWVDRTLREYGCLPRDAEDAVDNAAEESFPASDSPSWTAGTAEPGGRTR
jgi:hypothetical protein